MAVRMATSRPRTDPRTSSRFATLTQAMSNTTLTAPTSTSSEGRAFLTHVSCSGSTPKLNCGGMADGNRSRNSLAASCNRALAAPSVTPGVRRAATVKKCPCIVLLGSIWKGTTTSTLVLPFSMRPASPA